MQKDKTLYLIRGIPGSGKSTFAQTMESRRLGINIEADQFFTDEEGNYNFDVTRIGEAHAWCQKAAKTWLQGGYDVIVSNTSTTEKEVLVYSDIAEANDANFVSLIVENRHGNSNVHNVPAETLEKMKNRFTVKL